MSVRLTSGPNPILIAELTFGGPAPNRGPTERGCTGSVNSTRIVVPGSTLTSPLPGVISGWLRGGGVVMISGVSRSAPTVEAARTWLARDLPFAA